MLPSKVVSDACRGESCGQLKVTMTAPGHDPNAAPACYSSCYLDSASCPSVSSSSAQHRRLPADITSVAAPGRLALTAQHPEGRVRNNASSSKGNDGSVSQGPETTHADILSLELDSSAGDAQECVGNADPRVALRSQMQQLSKLSQLMSERLHMGEVQHPAAQEMPHKGRASAGCMSEVVDSNQVRPSSGDITTAVGRHREDEATQAASVLGGGPELTQQLQTGEMINKL